MTPTKWIMALIVAVMAIGGIYLVLPKDDQQTITDQTASNTVPDSVAPVAEQQDGTYTAGEVATHDSKSDCWTIINGDVYNLTSFVSNHPGGDEIVRACGIDGSTLFNSRETADGESIGSGTGHSSTAQSELASLKIGTLAN